MAKFGRFEGVFSWFFIELQTHTVKRDNYLMATAQRQKCSHNKGYIFAYFLLGMRETAIFPLRIWGRFQLIFHRKSKYTPYFYFRFIWPTDLESVPCVEPLTLIISIKFEVDLTIHRRVTVLLVRIRYVALWPWPFNLGPVSYTHLTLPTIYSV